MTEQFFSKIANSLDKNRELKVTTSFKVIWRTISDYVCQLLCWTSLEGSNVNIKNVYAFMMTTIKKVRYNL